MEYEMSGLSLGEWESGREEVVSSNAIHVSSNQSHYRGARERLKADIESHRSCHFLCK